MIPLKINSLSLYTETKISISLVTKYQSIIYLVEYEDQKSYLRLIGDYFIYILQLTLEGTIVYIKGDDKMTRYG